MRTKLRVIAGTSPPKAPGEERLVLTTALSAGYYEYPGKISATELAEKLGCNKSMLIEYLRQAENKVREEISGRIR